MNARSLLPTLALLLALGCNTAFHDAMSRGDALAAGGHWDEAAAAYAEATRLDPDDADARAALVRARRGQAAQRVEIGRRMLDAGDAKGALVPLSEAVRLDPQSPLARSTFEQAKARVLAGSRAALAAERFKDAFSLADACLAVAPDDREARELRETARGKIGDLAVQRGHAREESGETALAALEYAEALEYQTGRVDATEALSRVRQELRAAVTFHIALGNFDGDAGADDLGSDVNAAVLARGLDASLPLRVVDKLPAAGADPATRRPRRLAGMRLGGVFRGYHAGRAQTVSTRSCDYVCGRESVANPEYATAEAEMRAAQIALGQAEARASAARAGVGPAERERDQAQAQAAKLRLEAGRADQDLSACRARTPAPGSCGAEEQRKSRADEDARVAEQEAQRTATAAIAASGDAQAAESDASMKRADADAKKRRFSATPATVEQDKHCDYAFPVTTVVASAELECMLRGEGLYDTDPVLVQGVTGRVSQKDETYAPVAGRCAELVQGDPLALPSDAELRRLTLAATVSEAQKALLASFARYRNDFVARGDAAAVDQRGDVAAGEYLRFLYTFGDARGDAFERVAARAAAASGKSSAAVHIAVLGQGG